MKPQAIKNTALCRFDQDENAYVVESPLLGILIGAAETEDDAWEIFNELLNAMYIEYLEGKQVRAYKRGRPSKGGVIFNGMIKPDTIASIKKLSEELSISQGEAVDYLAFFYLCYKDQAKRFPSKPASMTKKPRKRVRSA